MIPSFQFYPADWLNDLNLRRATFEEKGFLIDLMCLLHQSKPYGHLSKEMEEDLPRLLGKDRRTLARLLAKVEEKSLISRDELTRIVSKRMVEDEARRQEWRTRKQRQRQEDVPRDVTPMSRPSSSSPSSSIPPYPPKGGGGIEKKFKNENSKTFFLLLKWLKKMPDVSAPEKLAEVYLQKFSARIVEKALKNPICTSRSKLSELCEFYSKKS